MFASVRAYFVCTETKIARKIRRRKNDRKKDGSEFGMNSATTAATLFYFRRPVAVADSARLF